MTRHTACNRWGGGGEEQRRKGPPLLVRSWYYDIETVGMYVAKT